MAPGARSGRDARREACCARVSAARSADPRSRAAATAAASSGSPLSVAAANGASLTLRTRPFAAAGTFLPADRGGARRTAPRRAGPRGNRAASDSRRRAGPAPPDDWRGNAPLPLARAPAPRRPAPADWRSPAGTHPAAGSSTVAILCCTRQTWISRSAVRAPGLDVDRDRRAEAGRRVDDLHAAHAVNGADRPAAPN